MAASEGIEWPTRSLRSHLATLAPSNGAGADLSAFSTFTNGVEAAMVLVQPFGSRREVMPMKKGIATTRIVVGAVAIAALFAAAEPAQAAQKVTRGSDCYLSAHWKVNISVTWYDNDPQYAVLTSPGKLNSHDDPPSVHMPGTYFPSFITATNPLSGSGSYSVAFDDVTPPGATTYTYRANITGGVTYQRVYVEPHTGPTANCNATLYR